MELPSDVYGIIFDNIDKITDLRKFTQTSKNINNICNKRISIIEKIYEQKSKTIRTYRNNFGFTNTKQKFAIELIFDECYYLLNNSFYEKGNHIFMFKMLAYGGNIELLNYIFDNFTIDKTVIQMSTHYASHGGKVDVLEYLYNIYDAIKDKMDYFDHKIIMDVGYEIDNADLFAWINIRKPMYCGMFSTIIKDNKINLVKFCINNNVEIMHPQLQILYCKNVEILNILCDNRYKINYLDLYKEANKTDSKDVIDWIFTKVDRNTLGI